MSDPDNNKALEVFYILLYYYINENRGYCSIDENRVSEVTMKGELRIEFQSQMALI